MVVSGEWAGLFNLRRSRVGAHRSPDTRPVVFSYSGFCEICNAPSTFAAEHEFFRESLAAPIHE